MDAVGGARASAKNGARRSRRARTAVTWVIAHRGASAEAKENTLPAFERAIELGADFVEFDVQASSDGGSSSSTTSARPAHTRARAASRASTASSASSDADSR